ncbi:hypothetical protein J1N35_034501, partial [Gossypium stocksii]
YLDLDLAQLEDKPTIIIDSSSEEEMLYHIQWQRSNRLSLMFLRMTTTNNIKISIPQTESMKEYFMFLNDAIHDHEI